MLEALTASTASAGWTERTSGCGTGRPGRYTASSRRHHCHSLISFLSAEGTGQQPRLAVCLNSGHVWVYDPEAGSTLHHLHGHEGFMTLACIASSSVAPHHPRMVSRCFHKVKVWDGETGAMLADLQKHEGGVLSVAVWKEHTGGHDRIATGEDREVTMSMTLVIPGGGMSHQPGLVGSHSSPRPQHM
jgi:hypothetical protein